MRSRGGTAKDLAVVTIRQRQREARAARMRSTHCNYGAHERCVDGAALVCMCHCHGTCACSLHPSRPRHLPADGSPETDPVVKVADTGTTIERENGAESEHRAAGEARPMGRWSP